MSHDPITLGDPYECTDDDGRVIATARVVTSSRGDTLHASITLPSGHHAPDAGARAVDAVLASATPGTVDLVHAVLPMGELTALERLRQRLHEPDVRAAGATVIVEGRPRLAD